MKHSNLLLGASALVLTIAGAFTTKAAKTHHNQQFKTKGVGGTGTCSSAYNRNSLTKVNRGAIHVFKTNGATAFTATNCSNTIFTVGD